MIAIQILIGVLTVFASLHIAKRYGDLAAAKYAEARDERQTKQLRDQIAAAIVADIRLARSIAQHNITSAKDPRSDQPRAFVAFQTATYERLLFSGDYPKLLEPVVLTVLMEYLAQARHVNAMISLFERMETTPQISGGPVLFRAKPQYVEHIGHYAEAIVKHLDQLESELKGNSLNDSLNSVRPVRAADRP